MKTASEIYAKVHKQTEGHAKDSLDVIYTAMTEFAEAYHEDKTRELNEELKSLRCELNAIYESEAGADL